MQAPFMADVVEYMYLSHGSVTKLRINHDYNIFIIILYSHDHTYQQRLKYSVEYFLNHHYIL